mmetsp:Transcript_27002/g.66865  ORF Transcript_27002/g.66865 Transcript_27002/m.66865 type:complete len:89 (-) Transcript_27002:948-1214(-)
MFPWPDPAGRTTPASAPMEEHGSEVPLYLGFHEWKLKELRGSQPLKFLRGHVNYPSRCPPRRSRTLQPLQGGVRVVLRLIMQQYNRTS